MKKQKIDDQNKVNQDLEELQTKVSDLEAQLKRAVADYHNLEKRVEEGRSELTNWAATELLRKLLGVLDHYDKALSGANDQDRQSGWFKGVELATNQFKSILREEGLEEISTNMLFDPTLHEAVEMRAGNDGEILEVAEKGYTLNGKVLKPAKVVVAKINKVNNEVIE